MSRLKIALDCDIPERLTEPMNLLYADQGFEFIHVRSLGHGRSHDEVWAKAFMQFGGVVSISADKRITKLPHKMLAFQESGLKSYFMQPPWSDQKLNFKAAHLVYWWPALMLHIPVCAAGECWQVPCALKNAEPEKFKQLKLPDHVIEAHTKTG